MLGVSGLELKLAIWIFQNPRNSIFFRKLKISVIKVGRRLLCEAFRDEASLAIEAILERDMK